MKKIVSLLLAAVMLVSVVPTAFAADTQDHSLGTQVVFTAENNENYTITVPASLNPGQSGTVTLEGYWPDSKTVTVTAEKTVTLKNSIKAADTKTLNVSFLGISEAGSNTSKQTFTEPVSVEGISNALFGKWNGKFNYNVESTEQIQGKNPALNPDDGSTPVDGEEYAHGDYVYTYSEVDEGWAVAINEEVTDCDQTSYGAILESINGKPIISLENTFEACEKLSTAPAIPDSVTNMKHTFLNCNLIEAPVIPDGVTNMCGTFEQCDDLTKAPVIPSSVTNMQGTFAECHGLKGTTIEINANPDEYSNCFSNIIMNTITLTGTSTMLDEIRATGIWDDMPPADDEQYTYGDYIYTYSAADEGWEVFINREVTDWNQTSYGAILESINGWPVVSMRETFANCVNLTEAPVIPDSVTHMFQTFMLCESLTETPVLPENVIDMCGTFAECTSLTEAPVIPDSVTDMDYTFNGCINLRTYVGSTDADGDFSNYVIPNRVGYMRDTFAGCRSLTKAPAIPDSVGVMDRTFLECTSLTQAPVIPDNVADIGGTFAECTSLNGIIEINTNPNDYEDCFYNVDMTNITLTGTSTMLNEIGDTGLNYTSGNNSDLNPDDGSTPIDVEEYAYGDYVYTYSEADGGWTVAINEEVTDYDQTSYGVILESINSKPITSMYETFTYCGNLTEAPIIPAGVTNMEATFYFCESLMEAPVIPDSVINMDYTFAGCTSLTGTVEINANPDSYDKCFCDVDMTNITLIGSSTILNGIGTTGLNYTVQ